MEWVIRNALASILVPPGSLLLIVLCGLALARRRALGRVLVAFGLAGLYLLSTQYVADFLLHTLEPRYRDPLADHTGQAIVVLGAGSYFNAPEYGGTTVNENALARQPATQRASALRRSISFPTHARCARAASTSARSSASAGIAYNSRLDDGSKTACPLCRVRLPSRA